MYLIKRFFFTKFKKKNMFVTTEHDNVQNMPKNDVRKVFRNVRSFYTLSVSFAFILTTQNATVTVNVSFGHICWRIVKISGFSYRVFLSLQYGKIWTLDDFTYSFDQILTETLFSIGLINVKNTSINTLTKCITIKHMYKQFLLAVYIIFTICISFFLN